MRFNTHYWLVVLAIAFSSLSCGKKSDPKAQSNGSLDLPSANRKSLDLTKSLELNATQNFRGWLLFWDPSASVEGVSKVLESTRNYFQAQMQFIKTVSETIIPVKDEISEINNRKQKVEKTAYRDLRAQVSQDLSTWLKSSIQSFETSDEQKLRATHAFELYCEAKIWEFSVSKVILETNYSKRPSPLAVCEEYYLASGLMLVESSACTPTSNGEGINYFDCLWSEGVKKTTLFRRVKDAEAIDQLPSSTIKEALANSTVIQNVGQQILKQAANVRISGNSYNFSFDGMQSQASASATWDNISTQILIYLFGVDRSVDITNDNLRLMALSENTALSETSDKLRNNIFFFASKLNDQLINKPFEGGNIKFETSTRDIKTICEENSAIDHSAVCGIAESNLVNVETATVDFEQQVEKLEKRLAKLEFRTLSSCDVNADSDQCSLRTAALEQQRTVLEQDSVSGVFLPNRLSLKVNRDDDSGFCMTLQFDEPGNSKKLNRCLDEGLTIDDDVISFDYQFAKKKISDVGLQTRVSPGDDIDFNNVELLDDEETHLAINLEAARWSDLADVLTGEVEIKQGDVKTSGVILFIDQDALQLTK